MAHKLSDLLGDTLVRCSSGEKVPTKSLCGKDKIVGLYFAAEWCPPCKSFTPKLQEFYKNVKNGTARPSSGVGAFEIVYVSWDKDEAGFNESLAAMPWIALPFSAKDKKTKLTKKFRTQGIPRLVILDGETGKTIAIDGFNHVLEDPNGCAFPWRRRPFWEMVKGQLVRGDSGQTVEAEEALKGKVVGLYFAANWCPPCKFFTPELTKTYEHLKENGKNFEVVFVTSDRSSESWQQHAGCMPWLAIPFDDPRLQQITSQFGIDGIPSLVILDEKGGLITMSGRQAIQHDSAGVDFPWHPKSLNELTQMAAVQLNENVCLILFTDGEDEELLEARAVLKDVAVREHEKGEDQELFFFYAGDDEFCDQVRDFASLEDRSPLLVILDSPAQLVYVSPATDMSCEVVEEFVDSYLADKLTPKPLRHASQQEA